MSKNVVLNERVVVGSTVSHTARGLCAGDFVLITPSDGGRPEEMSLVRLGRAVTI